MPSSQLKMRQPPKQIFVIFPNKNASNDRKSMTKTPIETQLKHRFKKNHRSKIVKKFGVKTQKSSELFAYIRKKQYLCGEFLKE